MALEKPAFTVLIFTFGYILAASLFALSQGNGEFVFYIVVMLVLCGAIWYVHSRVGLSAGLLWCLSIWGLLHVAGGLVPVPDSWPADGPIRVLYSLWLIPDLLKYDMVVHAYGFGVTTWMCWQGLVAAAAGVNGIVPVPTLGLLTLCAAAGMGFGALNEIIEFVATLTIPETNVGGYVNTWWDLVFNLIGSVIAAVVIRIGYLRKRVK